MAAAVFAGGDAALVLECLGEVALVPESRLDRDFREVLVCRLQQLSRGVKSDGGDVASWRDAEGARELETEIGLRRVDHRRKSL